MPDLKSALGLATSVSQGTHNTGPQLFFVPNSGAPENQDKINAALADALTAFEDIQANFAGNTMVGDKLSAMRVTLRDMQEVDPYRALLLTRKALNSFARVDSRLVSVMYHLQNDQITVYSVRDQP